MARKTKEDAEQTRLAILDSALQTFYEKGFSRTTFDEIAKRINLTKGAVYWHFRNKADIVAALIMHKVAQDNNVGLEQNINTIEDLKSALFQRAEIIEQDAELKRFLFFMIYRMEWSEAVLDNVWKQVGDIIDIPRKKLYDCLLHIQQNGAIKPEVNIDDLYNVLLCFWKGCVDNYIAGRGLDVNLSNVIIKGFDFIMAGVKVENN